MLSQALGGHFSKAAERSKIWFDGKLNASMTRTMMGRSYTPGSFFSFFKDYFTLRRVQGLGVLLSSALAGLYKRRPRFFAWAERWEPLAAQCFPSCGNDFLIELERHDRPL
jgi:hypothetical protein